MLDYLAANLAPGLLLLPRSLLEQQLRGSEISIATRLAKSLPMVQLSQRLLHESMNSPELSASESKAALEAIVCLLRPMLHHQEAQPSRRDKQFQKIMALIDESIQAEHLRPEWLASETGMSVRSLYRLFAEKGLVVAQYIKNRRLDLCARALQSAHDDEKLAGIGYSWGSAIIAISPPPLSSVSASRRESIASAADSYFFSHLPLRPFTYSPGCALATSFCPAIFAT